MFPIEKLSVAGDHPFVLQGNAGSMECIITIPQTINSSAIAIIGHPHSLQGGTMNNKVVTTLSRAFRDLGIINLRFNFRGVGHSEGQFDKGIGESEDMLLLIKQCQQHFPHAALILSGFSFGSYVSYRAALNTSPVLLISVAPPVNHFSFKPHALFQWVMLHGDKDEVVPYNDVKEFVRQSKQPIELITFADTTHFFHGKLLVLRDSVTEIVQRVLNGLV